MENLLARKPNLENRTILHPIQMEVVDRLLKDKYLCRDRFPRICRLTDGNIAIYDATLGQARIDGKLLISPEGLVMSNHDKNQVDIELENLRIYRDKLIEELDHK